MSDGIDMDGALEALSANLPDEAESVVQESEPVVEDNQPVASEAEAESFTGFDPSTLPEDMQAVYRSMQGDYTRKTQEIAELRRGFESFSEAGVDPDVALQAVGFLQELNTNPDFALQVAEEIRRNAGTTDVSQPTDAVTSEIVDPNYEGLPPQLASELQEMRAFRDEMLSMQAQQESLAELEAMENTIRTTNPQYSDDDLEAIYSLAYSTDGNLMAAQEVYAGIQQRLLGGYLKSKEVPMGATPAPAAPSSVPGRSFANLEEAHKAAMEALRNIS
jgi:hypothetical protein